MIQLAAALMPMHEGDVQGEVVAAWRGRDSRGDRRFRAGAAQPSPHSTDRSSGDCADSTVAAIELRTTVRVSRQIWHGIVEAARDEREPDPARVEGRACNDDAIFEPPSTRRSATRPATLPWRSRLNLANGETDSRASAWWSARRAGTSARHRPGQHVDGNGHGAAHRTAGRSGAHDDGLSPTASATSRNFEAVWRPRPRPDGISRGGRESRFRRRCHRAEAESHQVIVMGAARRCATARLFGPIADGSPGVATNRVSINRRRSCQATRPHEGGSSCPAAAWAARESNTDLSQSWISGLLRTRTTAAEFENIAELPG